MRGKRSFGVKKWEAKAIRSGKVVVWCMVRGSPKELEMSLGQPLLAGESTHPREDDTREKAEDYAAGRIYANNAPRIVLETITARTAFLVILLTYIFFIVCFSVDLYTTYQSFTSSNYNIPAYTCGSTNRPVNIHSPKAGSNYDGCSNGNSWNATVTDLNNVISIELSVQQINVTSLLVNSTSSFSIVYNVSLWACYDDNGCGNNFETSGKYTSDGNVWQKVLTLESETADVDKARDVDSSNDGTLEIQLVQNTFQNQESIPTNGLVSSYYIHVYYISSPYGLFTGEDPETQQYISYEFDVVDRPRQPVADGFTLFLLVLTVGVLIWYVHVLMKQKTILSEQKWIVGYFILVILFQNPAYCIITWYREPPSPGAAYTSYLFSYMGQSGLFMLWLFFADPVRRKLKSKFFFYLPKLLMGLSIFTASLVVLTFQFPGLDPSTPDRNAVEAVQNWSPSLKTSFVFFTMLYLVLIWVWTIYWFFQLYRTGRKLKKLPYMSTRYMQLSYQFFVVQATLVTLYYILQYAAVIYFISLGAKNGANAYDTTNLTDNINTLFREQSQLFGKALFLTVYAMTLAFFYLPADLLDNTGLATSLAATYTITEAEHNAVYRRRKANLNKLKKNLLNQVTGMNQLAYYDFPDVHTASGYEGTSIDLDSIGFTAVDKFYCSEYEVFCFIAREKATNRIVVCFRGTASKKQMEANLKYSQRPVNFEELDLPSLDQLDGLTIRKTHAATSPDEEFELESVSDCDEEEFRENADENIIIRRESEGGPGVNSTLSVRPQSRQSTSAHPDTMLERAGHVGEEIHRAFTGAVGATNQGLHKVMDATTGLVVTAAANAPMLKKIVLPHVHSGFWEAYQMVRGFIHGKLRQELVRDPAVVIFTGHSLGGALAAFAALDVSMHTIPRVNAYLKHHAKLLYAREKREGLSRSPSKTGRSGPVKGTSLLSSLLFHSPDAHASDNEDSQLSKLSIVQESEAKPVFVKKIKVLMYNFGSPRVGNRSFAQLYNRIVPSSFRVVVDGDLVAGLPPSKYQHIGTEILIDSLGAGSIIIDPSFVERWLRTHMKSSVAVHSLLVYRKGLLGLKLSAEYLKMQYDRERESNPQTDPLRLAIQMRHVHKIEHIFEAAPEFGHVWKVQEEAGGGGDMGHSTHDIEAGPISIVSDHGGEGIGMPSVTQSVLHDQVESARDDRRRRIGPAGESKSAHETVELNQV